MSYHVLSKYRTELMGIAILWVMLFHASGLDMGLSFLNLIRAAGFGGVDIFILLSSMGLVMSLGRREQDYSSFMARRAGRLLPAYFLVMVPYTIFLALCRDGHFSALIWNASLLYYWVRPPGAFNWYVAGAMTFYAVIPLCFRLLRRSPRREALTAAGILLGLVVGRLLMAEGYWYAMDFVYRIPIFLLGLLLGFYVLEGRKLNGTDILFWCVWLGLGIVYLLCFGKGPNPDYRPMCYLFLFTTVPMCLVICWCFDRLPLGWLRKFFRLLGGHSLEIYLLNVSLFAETELLGKFFHVQPGQRLFYLLSFAANIALGLPLHCLAEKLKTARGAA